MIYKRFGKDFSKTIYHFNSAIHKTKRADTEINPYRLFFCPSEPARIFCTAFCALRRGCGKSFLLRAKKKNTECPKGHSSTIWTDCNPSKVWTLLPASFKRSAFGTSCFVATMSQRSRSNRRHSHWWASSSMRIGLIICASGAQVQNLFSATPKEKYGIPKRVFRIFGGEERIWTFAPVARPTPLAGAPLHHLSTSPYEPWCLNSLNHYIKYFFVCQ